MKGFRHIGSVAFVLGLFTAVFAGMPWYVMVTDDPAAPWWLRVAVFLLLGGILVVLVTLALEQRAHKASVDEPRATESDRTVLLLNSDVLPRREITVAGGMLLLAEAWIKSYSVFEHGLRAPRPTRRGI